MSIPLKDTLLVPYSTNFNERINATPTVFGFTAAQGTEYTALHDPFIAAYNAMMNARADGTRSESLTAAKDTAKAALLGYARFLYGSVQNNAAVSDANKILLGVRIRSPHGTVPRPSVRPGMDIVSVDGRTVRVHIHDNASSTKRGKPKGALAALVYSFTGEDYPADPAAWTYQGSTTQAEFDVAFPETVAAGTRVWICAAWINRRQEAGPTNVPVAATIQYAGASAEGDLKIAA